MNALAVALLLASVAAPAAAESLCGGPVRDNAELDAFGEIPVGSPIGGQMVRRIGDCEESCTFVDRAGVRYLVADSFERKSLSFTRLPLARGPLGLSGQDTIETARARLSTDPEVADTLSLSDDGKALVTHYCFRNAIGEEFGLELHFEAGRLARYETYVLSPRL